MQVFREVKSQAGDIDLPQHFSFEQAPENINELAERNAYLASFGITAIWYQKGYYKYVDEILRLARNELRYRSQSQVQHTHENIVDIEPTSNSSWVAKKAKAIIMEIVQKFI